jgi:hypothetical protein
MSSAREIKESEARKKGFVTAAAAVGSVAMGVAVAPAAGVVGLGATAYLGYRWLKYRIDNGIRFT